ncbi:hypothetical protein ACFL6U_24070 [Planctomycetota bacterium]
MIRFITKTKYREMLLWVCCTVIAFPAITGQVLCIACDGPPRIMRETARNTCCEASENKNQASCCHKTTSESHEAEDAQSILKKHSPCACVDMPLDPQGNRILEKTDSQVFQTLDTVVIVELTGLYPKEHSILHTAPDRPPTDIGLLSTVILLI